MLNIGGGGGGNRGPSALGSAPSVDFYVSRVCQEVVWNRLIISASSTCKLL